MLLGSNQALKNTTAKSETELIAQLISESRFSEAYLLLKSEAPDKTETQYNLALCYYWIANYREALVCLDKAHLFMPVNQGKTNPINDSFYKALREKQNELDDHLLPITHKHVELTYQMVADSIVRLKIDCWLKLGEYQKVIDIATPIAYKGYKNINEAISVAKQNLKK